VDERKSLPASKLSVKHRVSPLRMPAKQGLTLVHFSAQLEPCMTQENTLHTLHTP